MNKIEELKILPEARLFIRYVDGVEFTVDLNPLISRGGIFERLKDPKYFVQVQIGPRGRSLVWPDDLDLCADALRLQWEDSISVAS